MMCVCVFGLGLLCFVCVLCVVRDDRCCVLSLWPAVC